MTTNEKEYHVILLKACMELLEKQNQSPYVLNLLNQTVTYDGADCDGHCLLEDIKIELEDLGEL